MRATHQLLLAFGLVLSLGLPPATARACSPLYSAGVTSIIPSGPTHPANALVLLFGGQMRLDADEEALAATVDGVPVSVVVDPERSRYIAQDYGYNLLALELLPAPAPGQVVRIEGSACGWGGCPIAIEYTATTPLEEVVPPVAAMRFSVRENQVEDPWSHGDSCDFSLLPVAEVRVNTLLPVTDVGVEGWRALRVTVTRGEGELVASRLVGWRGELAAAPFGLDVNDVGYPADLGGVCVSARILTATTVGPETTVCQPCAVRGPQDLARCMPEDGHCPFSLGDATSYEDPPPPCAVAGACSVHGPSTSTPWALALIAFAMGVVGLRRRARRR